MGLPITGVVQAGTAWYWLKTCQLLWLQCFYSINTTNFLNPLLFLFVSILFRHFTREALPRLDNYRNILSIQAVYRPTLDDLHNATMSNKVNKCKSKSCLISVWYLIEYEARLNQLLLMHFYATTRLISNFSQ